MWVWDVSPEEAFAQTYDAYAASIYRGILRLAKQYAPQIEAWMKQNAVWTDRTSNARQSLYAEVEALLFSIAISFDHGMEYGYWLEFANQGEYAIVGPALDYWSVQFWEAVKGLIEA